MYHLPLAPLDGGASAARPARRGPPRSLLFEDPRLGAPALGAPVSPRFSDNQDMQETPTRTEHQGATFAPSDIDDGAGMTLALALAEEARDADEVPIGAIVVRGGALLGIGRNRCRRDADATAHAELLALREAFERTGDMRLPGATVYTTVEPCFMCAGALAHARVARVVWAVRDPKFGGAASLGEVLSDPRLNHRAELREGVGADAARELLRGFFREKRAAARK